MRNTLIMLCLHCNRCVYQSIRLQREPIPLNIIRPSTHGPLGALRTTPEFLLTMYRPLEALRRTQGSLPAIRLPSGARQNNQDSPSQVAASWWPEYYPFEYEHPDSQDFLEAGPTNYQVR